MGCSAERLEREAESGGGAPATQGEAEAAEGSALCRTGDTGGGEHYTGGGRGAEAAEGSAHCRTGEGDIGGGGHHIGGGGGDIGGGGGDTGGRGRWSPVQDEKEGGTDRISSPRGGGQGADPPSPLSRSQPKRPLSRKAERSLFGGLFVGVAAELPNQPEGTGARPRLAP